MKLQIASAAGLAIALTLSACQTDQGGGAVGSASSGSAGATAGGGATAEGGAPTGGSTPSSGSGASIPSLVNVNLQNVLNDLSVRLQVDRANIPVNAQIPVSVAANVCGVSVSVLSVSTGGQASCTAKTSSAELAQVVQQQIAAGGSVGGGAQGGSTASTGGATATGGSGSSGATGTGGTSTGTSETTTRTP